MPSKGAALDGASEAGGASLAGAALGDALVPPQAAAMIAMLPNSTASLSDHLGDRDMRNSSS
jgi:hypothetical protein